MSTGAARRIVVVGGSLAGVAAVEELRHAGFDGEIVLVGAETMAPYDRPPLSKQLLAGAFEPADCRLRPVRWTDELGVDLRLGTSATALDTRARTVSLSDGASVGYDGLVVATGATPRRLPGADGDGICTLRALGDAIRLREGLVAGARLAVVGGGFIGAEVASTARTLGRDVTMIEALPAPLSRVLGPVIGELCAELHRGNGVRLHCGVPVDDIQADSEMYVIRLADGATIEADLILLGLGVTANTEWLRSSGLKLGDGVLCDASCRASAPGVVAAGDVARWPHPVLGSVRIEHWENAVSQGQAAARALLDPNDTTPFAPVPYVWSDQYDCKIQLVGHPAPGDELVMAEGRAEEFRFTALYGRAGRLTAGLTFNRRSPIRRIRRLLAQGSSLGAAIAELGDLETAA